MVNASEGQPASADAEIKRTTHWILSRRGPAFLGPLFRLGDKSLRRVAAAVQKSSVIADLGCGWGHYSFALADMVGPEGKVYAVDLARKCIMAIRRKAEKHGCRDIEAHESTAADLSFIKAGSVDLVFANGLLCSMAGGRPSAAVLAYSLILPDPRIGCRPKEVKRLAGPRRVPRLSRHVPFCALARHSDALRRSAPWDRRGL